MAGAFQADAFQNDAFQVGEPVPVVITDPDVDPEAVYAHAQIVSLSAAEKTGYLSVVTGDE